MIRAWKRLPARCPLPPAASLYRPGLFKALDKIAQRGRRVQIGTIRWFRAYVPAAAALPPDAAARQRGGAPRRLLAKVKAAAAALNLC
jgi:hypothetical protein